MTTANLFLGWILFTGSFEAPSLLMGGAFSLLIAIATFKIFIDDDEAARKVLLPRFHLLLFYIFLVLYKVYTAGFRVAISVLTNSYNPRVVHFRVRLHSHIARAVAAGSVTLTPGTIALELTEDHMVVHWLNAKTTHSRYAGNLIKGSMEKLLRRIWI
jgi:multicomponent Na+:H+ antiporter subunit E